MRYKNTKNSYKYVLVTLNYGEYRYILVSNKVMCSHFKQYRECLEHFPMLIEKFGSFPEVTHL